MQRITGFKGSQIEQLAYSAISYDSIQVDFRSNEKLKKFVSFFQQKDEKEFYKLIKCIRFGAVVYYTIVLK